ncbi:MAG: PAS domain S-box protein [Salinigranum sp.]
MATGTEPVRVVLLVGHTAPVTRRLAVEFERAGYAPTVCESPEAALDRLADADVFGVVGGHRLGDDLTGAELLRRVREARPEVPFVLVADDPAEATLERVRATAHSVQVPNGAGASAVVNHLCRAGRADARTEGERRYQSLIETSPAPINIFDSTGEILWGNDAVLDLLDVAGREALVGRSIFEFIHPEDRDFAETELEATVEDKRAVGPTDMRVVDVHGEIHHIRVSTAPGEFRGTPIGQAVVVDVTPLRETERRLREEQRFVENALDTLEDSFYVVDTEETLMRWNQAARETTGYDDDELGSMTVPELFVPDHRERISESIASALEEGSETVEAAILTKEGRRIHHEFRGRRLTDPDGEVIGIVGIGRDVSAQRERDQHIRVLDQFLRHNIRTDLNVMLGLSESIGAGEVSDVGAATETIQARGRHLLTQTRKHRKVVNLFTEPHAPVRIDLGEVLGHVVARLRNRFSDARIAVDASGSVDVLAIQQLGDALVELVENAVVHSDRERPSVEITVERVDGDVAVHIADDGPGIPGIERDIFEEGSQINQLHHGSGLGLWYAYWVVQLTEGSLAFDENVPRGSRLTLRLPSAPAE